MNVESLKISYLADAVGISAAVTKDSLAEFTTARAAVIADCQAYGYTYTAKSG